MGPGKKNAKATKKFEKSHLKGVLEKRKADAKVKQRAQQKAKKQSKRSRDDEFFKGPKADGENETAPKPKKKAHDATVSGMSVDDFFSGGFEIIDKKADDKKAKAGNGKLGKRKRDAPENDEDEDSDSASAGGDDDNSDAESDDAAVGMSKGAMDALAKDDPEFYKYLQENDPEALDFDENVDMAEIDELSGGEDSEQPKKKRKKDSKAAVEAESDDDDEFSSRNELTKAMVARWKASISETKSLRAARQVVLAFRSAAHLNEDDEEKKQKYSISDPEVFHDILIVALKQIPEVLQYHCPIKETASGKVTIPTETKKFKTLAILIKSYAASVLHLLGTLSDDATLKLTISALTPLLPYLLSFRKVLKNLIKTIVHFWSQSSSSEATRITAFLVLRRLVVIGDKGVREAVLKVTYQGLIQGSRSTNPNTIQGINLMKNSAAELWGIDQSIGYTTAFTFIRQLAIHLRNSITHNQNESYKAVYNWQYVHSLDFWSCVLAEHCSLLKEAEANKESQLKLLIYPLVQVTLGAMRLIPTALYFPLRFHLIRSLLRISRATGTYIPLASALLEVLNSAEMKKPPKATTLKTLDFSVQYKAPKSYLRTRIYQDGVGEQVVDLFCEYFATWSTNIAFPEFALPVVIMLKRWLKEARGNKKATKGNGNRNTKLVTQIALLVQKIEATAKFIEEKRNKVDFAPKNRDQVDKFLSGFDWEKTPIGVFVVAQRKLKAEKAKMMEEARKEDDKKRKEDEKRRIAGSDDEGGSEDESEGDEEEEEDDDDDVEVEEESKEEDEDEDEDE